MTDLNILNKALKVAWIPCIISILENMTFWKIIPNTTLEKCGELHFLTNCNFDINTLWVGNSLPFCVDILKKAND